MGSFGSRTRISSRTVSAAVGKLTFPQICPYKALDFPLTPSFSVASPSAQPVGGVQRGLMARHPADYETEQQGEADLSTEQAGAQASARLSRSYGDGRRPQDRCRPPGTWPQAAHRLRERFKKPISAHLSQNPFGRAPVAGKAMREPQDAGIDETDRPRGRVGVPARLKKRADFVKAAKGARAHAPSFSLQAIRRKNEGEFGPARFGFTVTKKVGGSVVRNRVRRRLKEALRLAPDLSARPGYDYVIVGRQAALSQEFAALREALAQAVAEIHASAGGARARAPRPAKPHRPPVCASTSLKKD